MRHAPSAAHLIDLSKCDDFWTFVETGMADDSFTEYINTNLACQRALELEAEYHEGVLYELYVAALVGRLKTAVKQLDPKWYDDCYLYFLTNEAGEKLGTYIAAHPDLEQALIEFLASEQQKLQATIDLYPQSDGSATDTMAEEFAARFSHIRQRWMQVEFGL